MLDLVSFIVIAMTFIINFIVAANMLSFLPQITFIPQEYRLFAESMVLMLCLSAIAFTPTAQSLFHWLNNLKTPNPDELARLQQNLEPVFAAADKNPDDFQIYIAEQDDINAYALGKNEIAVTRPLLSLLSDYELQGILAHELGHLHHSDSLKLVLINTLNLVTIISFKILEFINKAFYLCSRIPYFGFIALVFSLSIVVFSWFIRFLSVFPQKIGIILSRHQEHRVDIYAAKLGFGENLISALQKIDTVEKPSLWEKITAFLSSTHPPTYDRVEKIKTAI